MFINILKVFSREILSPVRVIQVIQKREFIKKDMYSFNIFSFIYSNSYICAYFLTYTNIHKKHTHNIYIYKIKNIDE